MPLACRYSFALLLLLGLLGATPLAQANGPQCESESRITQHFDNGAVWDLCWESRVRENLVLSDVYYTPPEGEPLRVLGSARLSQLHVAYDDSDVTYNDVTQYGLGGGYLLTLTEADCPDGELLTVMTRPALCRWTTTSDTGYRTSDQARKTPSLNLFSVSQVGAYAYVISWTFHADGTIEPGLGATGALQRSSENTELPFGRVLEGDEETLWLSHTHNYYWRLDFDLGESATDDQVSETRYELQSDGTRVRLSETFTTEQARRINPEQQLSWTVAADASDDSPAYIIEPIRNGHRFERQEVEPYSDFDFFVTVANDCERFASQNARFNPDCLNNVLEYVDGQSLNDADLIAWHRVAFHHVPRNEDQKHMHTHWDGFLIRPRHVLSGTSALNSASNTPPQLPDLVSRSNQLGDAIHEDINAFDAEGNTLSFTGTGLPPGVALSGQGHLHGETHTAGVYQVSITAWDETAQTTSEFEWRVGQPAGGKKKRGSVRIGLLGVLALWVAGRRFAGRQKHRQPNLTQASSGY